MTNPIINILGAKEWLNEHGQLHRTDGPALIYPNGTQRWFIHGKPHRIDGPAVIRSNGSTYWFIHGNQLTEDQFKEITQSEEHLNWYLLKIL